MEQFESFSVPDGPTISVWPAPERLGPGSMMRWVMDQPGDGREGQVYLPPESADILAGLLLSPELRRPDPGDAICGATSGSGDVCGRISGHPGLHQGVNAAGQPCTEWSGRDGRGGGRRGDGVLPERRQPDVSTSC